MEKILKIQFLKKSYKLFIESRNINLEILVFFFLFRHVSKFDMMQNKTVKKKQISVQKKKKNRQKLLHLSQESKT